MQIDAIADDLEDLGPPSDFGAAPPPLPPKRVSKGVWIAGAVVVVLMVALGIGAGVVLLGGDEPAAATQGAATEPSAEPEAPAEGPAEGNVVQMDEVVFGAEEEETAPAEP